MEFSRLPQGPQNVRRSGAVKGWAIMTRKKKPAMATITTIGYEQATLTDFIRTLQHEGVKTLVDVRELPISRRKGFSKSALAEALSASGIEYRHEKRLGSPSQIRKQLREDGNYVRFFREFAKYLGLQRDVMTDLASSSSGTIALMCYERNQEECHRTLVAEALCKLVGGQPKHLRVSTRSLADGDAKGPRVRAREGVSPA